MANVTPEQAMLYEALIEKGIDVQLEKWDGHKHIDLAIPSAKVNIEVDGKHHHSQKQALADLKRTFYSFKKGYATIRIPNCLTEDEETIEETAEYISSLILHSSKVIREDGKKVKYNGNVSELFIQLQKKGYLKGRYSRKKRSSQEIREKYPRRRYAKCQSCGARSNKGKPLCLECYRNYQRK